MKDITVYTCKDGRTRAYIRETKKVISYPRLVLEEKLGRELLPNEQVHHIDEDPLNNDPDNLTVMVHGEHQRTHNPVKYVDKKVECYWCGKTFIWTALQQRRHHGNGFDKVFCSKHCVGSYGQQIQSKRAGMAE